jgi:hypothetical protein
VEFTTGSRAEVPGKRKPVLTGQQQQQQQHDGDDDKSNLMIVLILNKTLT